MVATKKPVSKIKKSSTSVKSVQQKKVESTKPVVKSQVVADKTDKKPVVQEPVKPKIVETQPIEPQAVRSKPDQAIRDKLLAAIPKELHEEAANTGCGYAYRMVRVKTKGDRIRPTLKISNFFVDIGTTLFYRRDVGIEMKVVDEFHVELVSTKGIKETMTFASAQKDCDRQSRGFGVGGQSNPAWQNLFMIEKEDGTLETLHARRERIRDEKLAKIDG